MTRAAAAASTRPSICRRAAAGALLAAAATACAGLADEDPRRAAADVRAVVVHNPEGLAVRLHPVLRDRFGAPRALGRGAVIALRLPTGRYALSVGDAPPRFPIPLPPGELGYVPPPELEIVVRDAPPTVPGYAWIPGGPALRGDALGVGQEDERPLATPHVDGFWLATHETTNAQYAAFLNEIGERAVDRSWLDLDGAKCRVQWSPAARRFETDAPRMPVVTVGFAGAVAYCDWLTTTTGVPHRLPSETEWEKAARGPGSRVYAYGDTCRTAAANQESGRLRDVGCFEPNGFGLFDMTANAFEWCRDAYARRAYDGNRGEADAAADPMRVLRGGSFVLDGIFCRNAMRMRLRPTVRADDVGFRVLRGCRAAPEPKIR